ncbi:YihY/virulence factor BrkB family protein [Kineococcus rhizosphaerae]|uniref:Membrane protein n=1 Tax=Kineococcus rhizosphaerae TaxID=559628 RepID=A0A2T0R404_9ACTN|nr:YihY/virulence factor BrkB family protein [Kineococcus rhizosphaerae]PRY15083.1 membrane protein [Kineococcus rhizosphaerae]
MTFLRKLFADVHARLHGHDLFLVSAGVTFYAAIALVPSLVVVVRLLAAVIGPGQVVELADAVGRALPEAQGAGEVVRGLAATAVDVRWVAVLVALVPATVYGEGLRRGFARVSVRHPEPAPPAVRGRIGSWKVRAKALPLLLLAPAGFLAVLEVAPFLVRLFGSGSFGSSALAVYVALNVDWLVVSPVLVYVYKVLGPVRPGWWAALWGGYATGAFVSGFLQGFVLFLAIPVDLGAPFGGYAQVGGAVAVCLWLWVFTALTVYGYAVTLELQRHRDARTPHDAVSAV